MTNKSWRLNNVYLICGIASIGGGLFGFDISSMSGVLGTQAYKRFFNDPIGVHQGLITASMPFGSLVGTFGSSFAADRYSRKLTIQLASLVWVIGSIIQSSSLNIPMLVIGRLISGAAVGVTSSVVPVYQSEVAPKEIRGRVISFQQWAITWGILLGYFCQYGSSFIGGGPSFRNQSTAAFRIPWGLQVAPGLWLAIGMFFVPHSPRWLAAQDRWEEAIETLADLHGCGRVNHPKVLAEYQQIEFALRLQREEDQTNFRQMVEPRMLKRIFLGISIQMWSQLCGMNVMMYYIVYVFESAGIHEPLLAASIQYIINVVMTLPAILFLDRWGRRPSLIFGSIGMMSCLIVSGIVQAVYGEVNRHPTLHNQEITWLLVGKPAQSKVIIASSYLFVAIFATTWGPVSWTYPAEIFPLKVRAKAVSIATASNWAWNCALAFAVPPLLRAINWKMYLVFASFNALACIHMFLCAPETKGKTLEEMDEVFDSGRPAWRPGAAGSSLEKLQGEIERKQDSRARGFSQSRGSE